ncbi:MAG: hypothetical protein JJU06_11175 [Ectothiorhodospiraceae bacterium]|nr:hypothetical protein [Ectothiorhodospiraceae bacterium]MCH8504492.1 hypothetical protein [Ectothiorhodospiraceae bacterium]
MPNSASIRRLQVGEAFEFINDRGKPVELILKTELGTSVRMTVPMGGRMEFVMGQERGSLYLLEQASQRERFHLVSKERAAGRG